MEKTKEILDTTVENAKDIIIENFGFEQGKNFILLADFIKNRNS